MEYGSYKARVVGSLLVTGLRSKRRGRTQADRIASRALDDLKTQVAAYFAARKRPKVRRAKRTKAIEHTKGIRAEMTERSLWLVLYTCSHGEALRIAACASHAARATTPSPSSTPCSRRATSCKNAERCDGASGAASSRNSVICCSVKRSMSAGCPLDAPPRVRWPARRHRRTVRPCAQADRATIHRRFRRRARMVRWRGRCARRTAVRGACGKARGETRCREFPQRTPADGSLASR